MQKQWWAISYIGLKYPVFYTSKIMNFISYEKNLRPSNRKFPSIGVRFEGQQYLRWIFTISQCGELENLVASPSRTCDRDKFSPFSANSNPNCSRHNSKIYPHTEQAHSKRNGWTTCLNCLSNSIRKSTRKRNNAWRGLHTIEFFMHLDQ